MSDHDVAETSGRVVGVIPARWASTRLPGKPLVPICGKPLIAWVIERALQARRLERVLVATDDTRIVEAVAATGAEAVMTSPEHPSGTDRVAEAVQDIEADVVVNIQGDEPLVDPELLDRLADTLLENPAWHMATAATAFEREEEVVNPSAVKVVFDASGGALYFSRSVIPFVRDPGEAPPEPLHWRHLGLYAYRRDFLERMVHTPVSELEKAEALEQLRALQLGARIAVIKTRDLGMGVDTADDVTTVESLIRELGLDR